MAALWGQHAEGAAQEGMESLGLCREGRRSARGDLVEKIPQPPGAAVCLETREGLREGVISARSLRDALFLQGAGREDRIARIGKTGEIVFAEKIEQFGVLTRPIVDPVVARCPLHPLCGVGPLGWPTLDILGFAIEIEIKREAVGDNLAKRPVAHRVAYLEVLSRGLHAEDYDQVSKAVSFHCAER